MRKIALTLMAILAMCNATYAVVTFQVVDNGAVGSLYSYTVQAKGAGINTLGTFAVGGTVNQNGDEWTGIGTPANPANDSCVLFGELRLPDVAGGIWSGGTQPVAVTSEAGGTLTNYSATGGPGGIATWDDYLHTSTTLPDGSTWIDMLRIVLPASTTRTVGLTVWAVEGSAVNSYSSSGLSITSPSPPTLMGDCNLSGFVDGIDMSLFAQGWYGDVPAAWGSGDFNNDHVVNGMDMSLFATGWYSPNGAGGGGEAAAAVPEPSTIAMLILGALCLAGYRLRK
jgi:hypothetical protein